MFSWIRAWVSNKSDFGIKKVLDFDLITSEDLGSVIYGIHLRTLLGELPNCCIFFFSLEMDRQLTIAKSKV